MVRPNSMYLADYIIHHHYNVRQNTFIIAPTGSGKTYYILNVLAKDKKCLYLCDNNNLKSAVLKNPNTVEYGICNPNANIQVATYKQFGKETIYRTTDFINNYDYIIADEVHNLIDYSKFSNDTDLCRAIDGLVQTYENTKIIFFTATPYYLDCIKAEYPYFLNNFKIWDFSKVKEIKRYTNKRMAYISSMYQIKFVLEEYKEAFIYNGWKCLIYTPKIEDMHKIEEIVKEKGLNPVLIWSMNAKEPMNMYQQIARAALIETGTLIEPYNVLIINRATETGVNIYDEYMNLVIVNTINVTQQIQVRGRVRHDVDLLVLKDKDMLKVAKTIIIPPELLDVQLSKETLEHFIKEYGLKDTKREKYITVNKFLSLIKEEYEVSKKKIRINGKQVTSYKIQIKKDKE